MIKGGFKGEIVRPWDSGYDEARQEWNRRINKFPYAIAYCENKEDVSRSIKWARMRGVPLRLRGGGHHYEGYSVGNDALVIDVSHMNNVSVEDNTLIAEGGASNAELYRAVGHLGYAFPGGTCPTVCASGLTQGGGWGLSCRMMGLTCDSLKSAELIDGCGRLIRANKNNNEELFWALRGGGGGNFGVVTKLKFRLPKLRPKTVTLVELYYPDTDAMAQTRFWETWQHWLPCADERVTLQASIYYSAEEGFAVKSRGMFYGGPEQAKEAVAQLAELPGCEAAFKPMTFYEATQAIGSKYPPSEKFKSTGRFVTHPLQLEQIAHMVETLRCYPKGSVFTAYSLYALGGAVSRRNPEETAFFYRDAQYIAGLQSVWVKDEFEDEGIEWVDRNFPYLAGITAGSYINFPYSNLTDYMRAYYGANAGRLSRIKRTYDPYNVFRFQQSIR